MFENHEWSVRLPKILFVCFRFWLFFYLNNGRLLKRPRIWTDLIELQLSYCSEFCFLMFKWENVKRVYITHTFDRIVIFHMSWEFRLIQGFYWFYRYCIVCAHFIIIKYIVWYRNKPVVLQKRLKIDLCRSKFDFHQNLQKHKMKFSQN